MIIPEQPLALGARVADVAHRVGHRLHGLRVRRHVLVDVRLERRHRVLQARAALAFLASREELAVDRTQEEDRQHGHQDERLKRGAAQVAALARCARGDDASGGRGDDDELRDDDAEHSVEHELQRDRPD